ncbi:MAG: hypothetical protein ABS99_07865 [Acetobacteraceae bacterium SCN 69-10]|nr:MAG: hypothetical protein ABS99_07865 [Acetobacteraceae bacterium SCN 69-10]
MNGVVDARGALLQRIAQLRDSEPNFARFLAAAVAATETDDLARHTPEALETMLRRTYTRLGKREGRSHVIFEFEPEAPGQPESLEMFSADMPFIVDSVLAAIRAKGGVISFMSHPVLHLDPESHRVLDEAASVSISESLLLVEIEPLQSAEQRAEMIAEIDGTLTEVYRATRAWRTMLERLRRVVEDWKLNPPRAPVPTTAEAKEFIAWLAEHNFTFLGMREYRLDGEGPEAKFVPLVSSGLGILEDKDYHFLRAGTDYVEMTEQHLAFLGDPDPIMVTKANRRTRVHRRGAYMDYVGVKLYRENGTVSGELRIVGLFTSMALATPNLEVPIVRRKVTEVMRRWAYPPQSHAAKSLMAALDSYPRDELFQITEDQLFGFAKEIAALADRPRVRVLPRIDRFDNFVSVLVFVPRERYTSEARERIGLYLARIYDGRVSAYYPSFPEGELVRVQGAVFPSLVGAGPRQAAQEVAVQFGVAGRGMFDRLWATLGTQDDPQLPVWLIRSHQGILPRRFYGHVKTLTQTDAGYTGDEWWAEFSSTLAEVARPAPGLQVSPLSYDDLDVSYASYDERDAAYASYDEMDTDWSLAGAAG